VFSWGYGILGGLGHGSYNHSPSPKRIEVLGTEHIDKIVSGWTANLAITKGGKLFEWGWEKNFTTAIKCGMRFERMRRYLEFLQNLNMGWISFNSAQTAPKELKEFKILDEDGDHIQVPSTDVVIKNASTGSEFCAAVCADGRLFTWGSGIRGQLGLGEGIVTSREQPTEVELYHGISKEKRVATSVACGFQYLVVLDDKGEVWACGKGSTGCLGLQYMKDDVNSRRAFVPVNVNDSNIKHYLDQDQRKDRAINFQKLPPVSQVSAGLNHTLFLTEDGEVWACGRNNNLELGIPDFHDRWVPTYLSLHEVSKRFASAPHLALSKDERIIKVSAGNMHSAALTSKGRLVTWGMNRHGQCGQAADKALINESKSLFRTLAESALATPPHILEISKNTCPEVESTEAVEIHAGFYDTFVVMKDGLLLRVGSGINGGGNMVSNPDLTHQYPEAAGLNVSQVASGWRHVLAIGTR